jgi:hypothetical protein
VKFVLIYGGASLLILLVVMGPIRSRTLSRLDRVAPGSVAFTVANRRLFSDSLSLAAVGTDLGYRASSMTSAPCVTADAQGITFWDCTPLLYVGSIKWRSIASVGVRDSSTPWRRIAPSAIVVEVRVGSVEVPVPLFSPNGTKRMFASRRESAWLAGELESLRFGAEGASVAD